MFHASVKKRAKAKAVYHEVRTTIQGNKNKVDESKMVLKKYVRK